MKTVTQKVFGFLYKTCLANPGGIPSPTTIQRAFAVSSQMTGIQIGKNGVSEYDIVGTLTVYSPQILTVTIGVDKNYVQLVH